MYCAPTNYGFRSTIFLLSVSSILFSLSFSSLSLFFFFRPSNCTFLIFIFSPLHHFSTPTGILCCCCCCLPPAPSTQHPAPAHHPQHQQPCIMLLCSCMVSTHSPHPMTVVELPLTLSLRTSCCRHGHQPTTCLSLPCPNLASGLHESGLRHLSPTLQGSS